MFVSTDGAAAITRMVMDWCWIMRHGVVGQLVPGAGCWFSRFIGGGGGGWNDT